MSRTKPNMRETKVRLENINPDRMNMGFDMIALVTSLRLTSFSWIPAFAGMTNREAILSHTQNILRIGSIKKSAHTLCHSREGGNPAETIGRRPLEKYNFL